MKVKYFLLTHLLSISFLINAQTYIKNGQEVSGYWKIEQSPVICEGTVIVPVDKMLIIDKGVTVIFKSGSDFKRYTNDNDKNEKFDAGCLIVYGILVARGTPNSKVKFTADKEDGKWGGIIFVNSKQNEIENCIIEKTHYIRNFLPQVNIAGAITFIKSKGFVYNCVVKNAWSAVNAQNKSRVKVYNCVLSHNEYAIDVNSEAHLVAVNTITWNNKDDFFVSPNCSVIVESCIIQFFNDRVLNRGNSYFDKDPLLNEDFTISPESIGYKTGKYKRNIGLDNLL